MLTALLTFLQNIDAKILEIMRSSIANMEWTHPVILFFTDLHPIVFGVFLIGLWIYGVYQKDNGPKHVALDLFWHVLGAFTIYWVINQLLPVRPRPETIGSIPALITHLPDNSFPSGHAMFLGASWWALHILLGKKRIVIGFLSLGILTVTARVLAGIHYPGDILVGFLLGWGLVAIFAGLPHGKKYRTFAHTIPVKLASYFRL
ncbi:MAG: phosphatase PAP2 family protein [Candidatus Gracilibacteria bacterium]